MRRLAGRPGAELVDVIADVRRADDRAGRVLSGGRNSLRVRADVVGGRPQQLVVLPRVAL